jgi:DNA/RNA-binding domain of Phe-tRNA-synthetase-like protein
MGKAKSPSRGPSPIIPILSEEVRTGMRLGLVRAEPVAIGPAEKNLDDELAAIARKLQEEHSGKEPSAIEALRDARQLFRAFGVDPTRTRPSSEALLRRLLKGQGLPRIMNAVDVCTLCSLKYLLPLGLYDADKIDGQVVIKLGESGDSYPGIRKAEVNLEGRLALSDETGPFGNPTSDSFRTSVTQETTSVWMVIFAPASFSPQLLEQFVEDAGQAMARHLAPAGGETRISTFSA